jgi:aminocarboxymuconate-semialdehyde decarboxylase
MVKAAKKKKTPAKKPARKAKAGAAKKSARARGPSRKPVVIDVHAHILEPEVLEFTYAHSMFAQAVAGAGQGGKPEGVPEPLLKRMTTMPLRLADMDAMGVDIQVISPSILQQCTYFAEPEEGLRMETIVNDRVAEAVAAKPDRLVGLGSVPMQDVALAAQELERCVNSLGLRGVIISSNVNGREIGDASFRPFWAKAEQLGATIFVHPAGNTDPRMRRHRQLITLGQPLEEAFAQSSLIYEGVMDAFPKLKVLFAHGGGFLPFYTGRHDNDWRKGNSPSGMKKEFSSYLPRFYYDTVLFNPDMLEFLVTKVPVTHIMLASDYPFAEKQPVEYVRSTKKLSREDQDAILGRNAAKVLGISI